MMLGFGNQIMILFLNIGIVGAQFADFEKVAHSCSGNTFDFNWNYTLGVSIVVVEWKLNGSTGIAVHNFVASQPFTPSTGYTTRLTKISEVGIALSSLSESDYGDYTCSVTNSNGNQYDTDPLTLFVYDPWSAVFSISKTGGGDSVWLQSSINDDRTSYSWLYKDKEVGSKFQYKAIENGNYTLTLGRRGKCLIGSSSESILVTEISGLTTPSSTFSSDMSTTVSKPLSTISLDMSTTVSEVPPPPVTTSSAGLSQEIVITITISSSILALGVLILLIVLVVKQCRQKYTQTPAKNKGNRFATKQGNFSKKDALKSSIKPRKSKFSGKRNTKQESILLDKFKHTQFNNSQAPKDRMYEHYPQTTDYMYWNNSGNQHDFNHSHAERNMFKYGNQHDRYPKSHSGPNNRIGYQSNYPEHPGHNEGMFQYYRADKLYRGQKMYQGPYVAQYDHHIKNKPENKRKYEGRTYERNWDFLY